MKNLLIAIMFLPLVAKGQKYISESSYVKFFSSSPIEDITAESETSNSVIDITTGDVVFAIKIKDFQFEKSLMQEHFNENYLESDKYPKATFKGKLIGLEDKEGKQELEAKGELTIHGITQTVSMKGTLEKTDGKIEINSFFKVKLVDHKIKIPKAVFFNIAEIIDVTVRFTYEPYSK